MPSMYQQTVITPQGIMSGPVPLWTPEEMMQECNLNPESEADRLKFAEIMATRNLPFSMTEEGPQFNAFDRAALLASTGRTVVAIFGLN